MAKPSEIKFKMTYFFLEFNFKFNYDSTFLKFVEITLKVKAHNWKKWLSTCFYLFGNIYYYFGELVWPESLKLDSLT